MTALKPTETRNVVAVASERYPVSPTCSVPECAEPGTIHHAFPRSYINSDSYFVSIDGGEPIPHAVGLCGSGTTGHHGDVEEHRAWLRLEDGVWNWYERAPRTSPLVEGETLSDFGMQLLGREDEWKLVGPLDPQPGYAGGTKKRKRKQGEERRKRKTISIRVPTDSEDGGAIYDDTLELVKEHLVAMGLYGPEDNIAAYEATIAAWTDWLNS